MQENQVCRSCLAVEGKFFYLHDPNTAQAYESITGYPLVVDAWPQHLCAFCHAELRRLADFRARARRVLRVLRKRVPQGRRVTKQLSRDLTATCVDLKPRYVRTKTITIDITNSEPETVLMYGPTELCEFAHFRGVKKEKVDETNDTVKAFEDPKPDIDTLVDVDVSDVLDTHLDVDVLDTPIDVDSSPENESKHDPELFLEVKPLPLHFNEVTDIINSKNVNKKTRKGVTKRKGKIKGINTIQSLNSNKVIKDYARKYGFNIKFLSLAEQFKEVEEKKNEIIVGQACQKCGKHFRDAIALERHTRAYHVWKPGYLVCDICECVFKRRLTLKSHMENHSWIFSCKNCDFKTNQSKTLMGHNGFHAGKRFACQFCDKYYERKTSYLTHVRLLHASELPWCKLCGEFFISEKGVERHINLTHEMAVEFPSACHKCDKRFRSDVALERHTTVQGCEQPSCAQCGDRFPADALLKHHLVQRHFAALEPDHFDCDRCNVRFHNMSALEQHSCGRGVACAACGARCAGADALVQHVFDVHGIFCCALCGRQFTNAVYFKKHYALVHLRAPSTALEPNLDHNRKQERSDKGVSRMRRGPAEVGVRKWRVVSDSQVVAERAGGGGEGGQGEGRRAAVTRVCEVCGRGFTTNQGLASHQLTHTGENRFSCSHCSKGFKQKYCLQMHERTHTGERPLACAHCRKRFRTYCGLRRHLLIHSGERKHVCAICNKTFQTSTCVKTHIKTAHLHQPWPKRNRRRKELSTNNDMTNHMTTIMTT